MTFSEFLWLLQFFLIPHYFHSLTSPLKGWTNYKRYFFLPLLQIQLLAAGLYWKRYIKTMLQESDGV